MAAGRYSGGGEPSAEGEVIAFFHDTDHGFPRIQYDFVTVVIIVSGGAVVAFLLPFYMDSPAVGKKPSVPCGVMALKGQIAFPQILIFGILDQDVFESQLLAVSSVYMGAVTASLLPSRPG